MWEARKIVAEYENIQSTLLISQETLTELARKYTENL